MTITTNLGANNNTPAPAVFDYVLRLIVKLTNWQNRTVNSADFEICFSKNCHSKNFELWTFVIFGSDAVTGIECIKKNDRNEVDRKCIFGDFFEKKIEAIRMMDVWMNERLIWN